MSTIETLHFLKLRKKKKKKKKKDAPVFLAMNRRQRDPFIPVLATADIRREKRTFPKKLLSCSYISGVKENSV